MAASLARLPAFLLAAGLTNVASVDAYNAMTFAVLANGTIMTIGVVPFWARVEGGDKTVATFPIPLVIKNLKNPT